MLSNDKFTHTTGDKISAVTLLGEVQALTMFEVYTLSSYMSGNKYMILSWSDKVASYREQWPHL